jgi:PAS domain S-box-containing protein
MEDRKKKRQQEGAGAEVAWRDEFLFGAMLDGLPQKVCIKDIHSAYILCNDNFASDLKIERRDIKGKTDHDFFPKELADKYRTDDRRVIGSGKPEDLEEAYVQDGKETVVNTYKVPIRNDKGDIVGIFVSFWDITRYKIAEIEANRKNATLNAINKIFSRAISCKNEEDLSKTCLAVAEELTESRYGFIGEVNPAGRYDTIALSDPGWNDCRLPQTQATAMIRNMEIRGIWGEVIKTGRSLISNDPSTHPDRVGLPADHPPLTSFLGVPLIHRGNTFGMIALANKEKGYEQADLEALEAIAMPIAEALRAKRSENRLSQQAQEIIEISTPVVQVWEGVVVAPLIGMLDSERTYKFMERFLNGIVETNSPVAMVDITGVPAIDTQTAQHLIETITAARLLGTKVILTGVRPAIAQTLVHLGIDLSDVVTRSSMAAGLKVALEMLDLQIIRKK